MSFNIIPAAEWGRDLTGSPSKSKPRQITELTIHYTGAPAVRASKATIAARIKQTERQHKARPGENMSTLGYSFLIDKWGRIWEGRGWGLRNAANGARKGQKSSNDTSYSVCLLVGIDDNEPTEEMINAVRWLRMEAEQRTKNKIVVRGHRDHIATSCPGEALYRHVKRGTFLQPPVGTDAFPAPQPTPPPAAPGCEKQRLSRGARGDCVKFLQRALKTAGHDPGPIDGIFGTRTEAAVKALQKASKMRALGTVGPKTWGHLR